jgi:hypothetical protein
MTRLVVPPGRRLRCLAQCYRDRRLSRAWVQSDVTTHPSTTAATSTTGRPFLDAGCTLSPIYQSQPLVFGALAIGADTQIKRRALRFLGAHWLGSCPTLRQACHVSVMISAGRKPGLSAVLERHFQKGISARPISRPIGRDNAAGCCGAAGGRGAFAAAALRRATMTMVLALVERWRAAAAGDHPGLHFEPTRAPLQCDLAGIRPGMVIYTLTVCQSDPPLQGRCKFVISRSLRQQPIITPPDHGSPMRRSVGKSPSLASTGAGHGPVYGASQAFSLSK